MAFLKRLSDNFWSYVSPTKPNATKATTPPTIPKIKKRGRPPKKQQRVEGAVKHSRSMSPIERVDSWRVKSSASLASSSRKRKRAAPITPSTGVGRRRKIMKMEDEDMGYTPEFQDDSDVEMDDVDYEDAHNQNGEVEEDDELSVDNIRVAKSPSSRARSRSSSSHRSSPKGYDYEPASPDAEVDRSVVVSEEEYNRDSPYRKMRVISPTKAQFSRGVSTEELRQQGWDDDHITLVQKLAMRGFEPLMPAHWKFNYRWLPDALFADNDDAFVSSVRGDHYHAIMALEKLFELGSRVRDRVFLNGRVKPEEQTRRGVTEFIKWAEQDSGQDRRTAIPMLALECKSNDVEVEKIQASAKRKLARLAFRYREAFRVSNSIEASPVSRTSTLLAYPVPTLYAIIASHTLIALVAYKPDEDDPEIKSVAFFDMKDKDYDVWNALALAIAVCHVRNVQMRIAEDTGIGLKSANFEEDVEDDPDL